jgi:capsular polysaccharide transport system permease protein
VLSFKLEDRRTVHRSVGIRPQFKDYVFRWLFVFTTLFALVLPVAAGGLYILFMESEEYLSETRFVIRSAQSAISSKKGNKVSSKIAQDTQVVTNFLGSAGFVEALEKKMDIRHFFGREDIDFLSALPRDATREAKVEYFEDRIESSIAPSSGIVNVEVTAFSPQEAKQFLDIVLEISEEHINQLNQRIWADLIATSEQEFKLAEANLQERRLAIQKKQLDAGVFSVDLKAENTSDLIKKIQEEVLTLQSRLSLLETKAETRSPLLKQLRERLATRQRQIDGLQAQLAGQQQQEGTLSDISRGFSQLELEKQLAEERFALSVRELKRVELLGSMQLVYLDRFMGPTLPQDVAGLNRFESFLVFIGICLGIWGGLMGGLTVARNFLDR